MFSDLMCAARSTQHAARSTQHAARSTLNSAFFWAFTFFLAALIGLSTSAARADTLLDIVLTPPIRTGANSDGLAITPNGKFAYVTNYQANTVSVIDTQTNTVVDTIADPSFREPIRVAITPDGRDAYVTNQLNPGTISVIDTATNTVVQVITDTSFIQPWDIAFTPDGKFAYVVDLGNGTFHAVHVIDLATNTVVGSPIPVGTSPREIVFTPDGDYAYVTNSGDGTVSVISTATNTVVNTIAVGAAPRGDAITPDGQFVYVTNSGDGTVSVINTALALTDPADAVVSTVTIGGSPWGVAISTPGGQYAYATSLTGSTLSVIDTATNRVVKTFTVGTAAGLYSIAFTPDGQFAYIVNSSTNVVNVITLANLSSLPALGHVNSVYAGTVTVSDANAGASTFSLTAGSLPPGLSLDPATGKITGTPTATGTYTFTVSADSTVRGLTQTGVTRDYTIVVDAALPAAAAGVPTLGDATLAALALLLAGGAALRLRRKVA